MPLSIIVTAIIFIVVLVMVIVYFTMNFWDSGETISNSAPDCSKSNQIISQMGIKQVTSCIKGQPGEGCLEYDDKTNENNKYPGECAENWIRISGVKVEGQGVCCGKRE